MHYEVSEGPYPLLSISLAAGESLDAEVRAFVSMVGRAEISSVPLKLSKSNLKKVLAGKKSGVTNHFVASIASKLTFTSGLPGEILALDIQADRPMLARPGAYVASAGAVTMDVELRKLGTTSRLPLLRFDGEGPIFLGSSGAVHSIFLTDGKTMTLDSAHLLACDVGLEVHDVSEKGLSSSITGQQLLELTGAGRILIQSLPRAPRSSPLTDALKALTSLI